jgi:hypothetical protein
MARRTCQATLSSPARSQAPRPEVVDEPSHATRRQNGSVGEISHAQLAVGSLGKTRQGGVLTRGDPRGVNEIDIRAARQRQDNTHERWPEGLLCRSQRTDPSLPRKVPASTSTRAPFAHTYGAPRTDSWGDRCRIVTQRCSVNESIPGDSLAYRVGTADRGRQQLAHRAGDRRPDLAQHLDARRHVELRGQPRRSGLPGQAAIPSSLRSAITWAALRKISRRSNAPLGPCREHGLGRVSRPDDVLRRRRVRTHLTIPR